MATLHNNNFGARHFKNRQPYKTRMIKYDEFQAAQAGLSKQPSTETLNLKVLRKDMSPREVLRKNPSRYPIKRQSPEARQIFEDLPYQRRPKRKEETYAMRRALVKKKAGEGGAQSPKIQLQAQMKVTEKTEATIL